jgi:hypothetical protein
MPHVVARIWSPVAYAATVAAVFGCAVAGFAWFETSVGFNAIWVRAGVVALVIAAMLAGVAFGVATLLLAKFESLSRPGWRDHLRQAAPLYAIAGWWCVWLIDTRPRLGRGLQWGLVAAATALVVFAAIVNAVTLVVIAIRRARLGQDQAATTRSVRRRP